MKVQATYCVHPKRAEQMASLARGLGAQIAFEQPADVEVINDEQFEFHETINAGDAAIVETAEGDWHRVRLWSLMSPSLR